MGLIRSLHCQMCKEKEYYDQIQKILLFEIVARTLKQMFRMCLRTTALRAKSASDVPFKNCSTQFLNLICSQENESLFWSETLPSQVFKRFGSCSLRSEERAELRYQFSLNRLIHRLTRDCGITLDLKCVEEMIGHSFEFTRGDIESVEPKFRAMFTTQHAEGQLYALLSMKRENQQRDPEIVKRLSQNSIERLEKAVKRFPSDVDTRHSLSDAHHTFACACQREKCEENVEDIINFHFKRARELRSSDVRCSISNVSHKVATLGIVLNKLRFKQHSGLVNDIVDFGFNGNVVSYDVFKREKGKSMYFLPLAINPEHFERSENILMQEIRRIYSGGECTAERILALVGTAMNRLVVDYVRSIRRACLSLLSIKPQQYHSKINTNDRNTGKKKCRR